MPGTFILNGISSMTKCHGPEILFILLWHTGSRSGAYGKLDTMSRLNLWRFRRFMLLLPMRFEQMHSYLSWPRRISPHCTWSISWARNDGWWRLISWSIQRLFQYLEETIERDGRMSEVVNESRVVKDLVTGHMKLFKLCGKYYPAGKLGPRRMGTEACVW